MRQRQTAKVIRDLNRFVENVVTQVVVHVTRELELATPEDTGWAQHNWIPSLDRETDPKGSKTNVGLAASSQDAGIAEVVSGYKLPARAFITNNVPYIDILNSPQTNSRKAPPGFVQASIAIGIKSVT